MALRQNLVASAARREVLDVFVSAVIAKVSVNVSRRLDLQARAKASIEQGRAPTLVDVALQ